MLLMFSLVGIESGIGAGTGNGTVRASEKTAMLMEIDRRMSDSTKRQQAVIQGQERALLCGYCHGEDGNSVRTDVPNLAGQNPAYLLQQINKFATGERKDYVMNSLAGKFSRDEQINLAMYYASQKPKSNMVDQKLARQGRQIYQANCQSCHGVSGYGQQDYARLAGQKEAYITKTLLRFRNTGLQRAAPTAATRRSVQMEAISRRLSDKEIKSLAAYLAQIR